MGSVNVASVADIEKLERETPFEKTCKFNNTYDAIKVTAERIPNKTAISFFLNGKDYQNATDISYQTLLTNITKTANFFNNLGLTSNDVVAFILPNLPETHYVMWGAEVRCQVFAINPLLGPEQIKELINSAKAKVVVTMNPMPQIDLWDKLSGIMSELTTTKYVVGVDIAHHVSGLKGFIAKGLQSIKRSKADIPDHIKYHNFTSAYSKCSGKQLEFNRNFDKQTISSLFCASGCAAITQRRQDDSWRAALISRERCFSDRPSTIYGWRASSDSDTSRIPR